MKFTGYQSSVVSHIAPANPILFKFDRVDYIGSP